MDDVRSWRDRGARWRAMAETGDDGLLREHLLDLADDADAIATELEVNVGNVADQTDEQAP